MNCCCCLNFWRNNHNCMLMTCLTSNSLDHWITHKPLEVARMPNRPQTVKSQSAGTHQKSFSCNSKFFTGVKHKFYLLAWFILSYRQSRISWAARADWLLRHTFMTSYNLIIPLEMSWTAFWDTSRLQWCNVILSPVDIHLTDLDLFWSWMRQRSATLWADNFCYMWQLNQT